MTTPLRKTRLTRRGTLVLFTILPMICAAVFLVAFEPPARAEETRDIGGERAVGAEPTAAPRIATATHNAGRDCLTCHPSFMAAGTIFQDSRGAETAPGATVVFTNPSGGEIAATTNPAGNLVVDSIPDGRYLIRVQSVTGRTWHSIPAQKSCNLCHLVGGNGTLTRTVLLPASHTQLPDDNDCRRCHHFPASQSYSTLRTTGVLYMAAAVPPVPRSQVDILGRVFEFDPAQYDIKTARPDIFAPGYFSMFDVITAVARKNGIPLSFRFDLSCMTYFIRSIEGRNGNFWYRFSYDTNGGNAGELNNRRANRWDEALWRPGVWIKVVEGEALDEIKAEYREEIARERTQGHVIPSVRITINPTNFRGNPPDSGRVTVSRDFTNVRVTPHDWRGTGTETPYPKPFRPGVVTSLDILLSLRDQGALDLVTGAFYTHFAGNYINSYYVVALGFPGVGTAHSSGRQGFVYTTENGVPSRLPNNAASTQHILSDIHVVHAPDFSQWRWAELGNPYYEKDEPGFDALLEASVKEDFEALGRGFNLYDPKIPSPSSATEQKDRSLAVGFNIFEPGRYRIEVRTTDGKPVATLFDAEIETIGARSVLWTPAASAAGDYSIRMTGGRNTQIRPITIR